MKNIARTRLFHCLIFLFLVFAQSCKRELFEPSQTSAQAASKIQEIKYAEFIAVVNTSGMGNLKELLAPANQGGNGQKLMSTNVSEQQFRIDMNAVKKVVLGDTVSYVVSLMPSSAHAVHFQNLTVQKIKDKTTAFLATYTPSKEWIADWKNGRHLAFSGTVSFSRIDPKLINENAGTAANIEPASNQTSIGAGNGKVSSVATANKISLAPGECEIFDIYSIAAHQCSTGDWPGSCSWEKDGLTDNDKKTGLISLIIPYK